MNNPVAVEIDALGKLLSLAKSLQEAMKDVPEDKAIERVLIRTTPLGQLAFQVKGGSLWRFFAITLPGREKEYDLGQNLAQLQSLFRSLSCHTDQEIRRAAQGMAMYGDTVIDTSDAVLTLSLLEKSLNSLIDHIKQKKLRRQSDDERKKNIADALDGMKISFRPKSELMVASVLPPKKTTRRKVVADKAIDELLDALRSKYSLQNAFPYELAYTQGRFCALERCKKELLLWQEGTSQPSDALARFRNVKSLLHEWDSASPEVSQLKQQAHDARNKAISSLQDIHERLERLIHSLDGNQKDNQEKCAFCEKVKKQRTLVERHQALLEDQEQNVLLELFRRCGEHYLVLPQQYQLDVQELQHAVSGQKDVIEKLEEAIGLLEREHLSAPKAISDENRDGTKKSTTRRKSR
jgi:hypothetical protein